jgi:hypothetical protein
MRGHEERIMKRECSMEGDIKGPPTVAAPRHVAQNP